MYAIQETTYSRFYSQHVGSIAIISTKVVKGTEIQLQSVAPCMVP